MTEAGIRTLVSAVFRPQSSVFLPGPPSTGLALLLEENSATESARTPSEETQGRAGVIHEWTRMGKKQGKICRLLHLERVREPVRGYTFFAEERIITAGRRRPQAAKLAMKRCPDVVGCTKMRFPYSIKKVPIAKEDFSEPTDAASGENTANRDGQRKRSEPKSWFKERNEKMAD